MKTLEQRQRNFKLSHVSYQYNLSPLFPTPTQSVLVRSYLTGDEVGENGEQRKRSFQVPNLSGWGMLATWHSIQTAQQFTWTGQNTCRYISGTLLSSLHRYQDTQNTHTQTQTEDDNPTGFIQTLRGKIQGLFWSTFNDHFCSFQGPKKMEKSKHHHQRKCRLWPEQKRK